jgi:hypothetical protein
MDGTGPGASVQSSVAEQSRRSIGGRICEVFCFLHKEVYYPGVNWWLYKTVRGRDLQADCEGRVLLGGIDRNSLFCLGRPRIFLGAFVSLGIEKG